MINMKTLFFLFIFVLSLCWSNPVDRVELQPLQIKKLTEFNTTGIVFIAMAEITANYTFDLEMIRGHEIVWGFIDIDIYIDSSSHLPGDYIQLRNPHDHNITVEYVMSYRPHSPPPPTPVPTPTPIPIHHKSSNGLTNGVKVMLILFFMSVIIICCIFFYYLFIKDNRIVNCI